MILEHDFTGLKCPLPVLKAKRVLKNLNKGEKVIFLSDDPASPIDFSHFCENQGYELRINSSKTGIHFFTITNL